MDSALTAGKAGPESGKISFFRRDELPGVDILDVQRSSHPMSFYLSGYIIPYIVDSHSTVRFGRSRMTACNQQVFVGGPMTVFQILKMPHPETVKCLFLPPALVQRLSEELQLEGEESPAEGRSSNDPKLSDTLRRFHECLEGKRTTGLEIESRFLQVMRNVLEWTRDRKPSRARGSAGKESRAVQQARALIDERCGEKLTLAELAEETGLSRFQILRAFSREVGVPPHTYQLYRRIDKARALLIEGIAPASVAADLGFYDQSHFIRCFKNQLGLTPLEYTGA